MQRWIRSYKELSPVIPGTLSSWIQILTQRQKSGKLFNLIIRYYSLETIDLLIFVFQVSLVIHVVKRRSTIYCYCISKIIFFPDLENVQICFVA